MNRNKPRPTLKGPAILFLTGASGVGKTALVSAARARSPTESVRFCHFDSTGVPSVPPAGWQETTTHRWIERIVAGHKDAALVVIEGSSDLRFVQEAFARFLVTDGYIILVHCEERERIRRLTDDRKQPELATRQMDSWARYLFEQAQQMRVAVLDTSGQTLHQSLDALEREIASIIETLRLPIS